MIFIVLLIFAVVGLGAFWIVSDNLILRVVLTLVLLASAAGMYFGSEPLWLPTAGLVLVCLVSGLFFAIDSAS